MDPIGAAQRHLQLYSKCLADSLYAIEHRAALPPAEHAALRASVVLAAAEMDRLVGALPDYAAAVGPREALAGRVAAGEARRAALATGLASSVQGAEARLAQATRVLQAALGAATGSAGQTGQGSAGREGGMGEG